MREFEIATNEVIVSSSSTVVRAMGGPALTVRPVKRPACAKCHIIPGIAEKTASWNGRTYDLACFRKVVIAEKAAGRL